MFTLAIKKYNKKKTESKLWKGYNKKGDGRQELEPLYEADGR